MGYIRNQAIIVSGFDAARVSRAHFVARAIFTSNGLSQLLSDIVPHVANGGASFFVSPDGSKEGWEPSDRGDKARAEFIVWLKSKEASDLYLNWCELLVGGDDDEYRVTDSPNGTDET